MTRPELCEALQTPEDAPAGEILASWERRRSEIGAALAAEANAKPVKLRLREELRRLEGAEPVAVQLRLAAEFERYWAEYAAEQAKPRAARGVLALCLDKAKTAMAQIGDPELRFACEKRIASAASPLPSRSGGPPLSEEQAAGRRFHVPSSFDDPAVLELHPMPTGETLRQAAPVVRIVARSRFTLGRQSGADLVARFHPATEENLRRTSTISRINTTLFVRGRQIWVQDGQGGDPEPLQPSRNGTVIDDTPIRGPLALNFTKERRLRLGQFGYEVKARHLPGSPDAETRPPDSPAGCVRFVVNPAPASERRPAGEAAAPPVVHIWILSEVTLGSAADAAVRLGGSPAPVAARIRFGDDRFRLEVAPAGAGTVALDGRICGGGGVFDLSPHQELSIGDQRFALRQC